MRNPFRRRWWVVRHCLSGDWWVGSIRLPGVPPMSSWFFLFSVRGPYECEADARKAGPK